MFKNSNGNLNKHKTGNRNVKTNPIGTSVISNVSQYKSRYCARNKLQNDLPPNIKTMIL
jgi:hypothetical protein